jgi:putative addiction module component (TIGR02574 family)
MASAVDIIEKQIRALSTSDKEALLRVLLEELDGPADPEVEAAWLEEVRRRDQDLDTGKVQAIPADEVFGRLRARIRQ